LVDLSQYLPILIFLGIALALSSVFVFLPMVVGRLTGAHKPNPEKLSEYECGFPAFEDPRNQFDVRFYLVAILFIIFDLEAAFLFPWAVSLEEIGWAGWATMMIFIFELVLGPRLRLEKGSTRLGVELERPHTGLAPAPGTQPDPQFFSALSSRSAGQGLSRHLDGRAVPVGAHRLALVDDLRARVLRGRDDPCEHAAL
jgi:NADH-quinone oxidoreductase subunit A